MTRVVPGRTCRQPLFQLASMMTSQFGDQLFVKVNGSPTVVRLRLSLNDGIAHLHTGSHDLGASGREIHVQPTEAEQLLATQPTSQ
jgi:hypothetical protein